MKSFNLVDEPWIRTNRGVLSLRSIFQESGTVALQENSIDRFCLFRFLIAVCQAACRLKTEKEWEKLDDDGLCSAVLRYLEEKREFFDLYDPERPFLQYPDIRASKDKQLPISAYVPGASSGNTTVVFQSNVMEEDLDDARKTKIVLMHCIMSYFRTKIDSKIVLRKGFNKNAVAPLCPALGKEGVLHTFVLGDTFFETLRLSLMSEELLEEVAYVDEIGIPPWKALPMEDDEVARRLSRSYFGHLIPMIRFCFLDGEILHSTSGVVMPDVSTGHVDFSVTVRKESGVKQHLYGALAANTMNQPWRQLDSILNFCAPTPDYQCLNVKFANARKSNLTGLWCFGLQVSSQGKEQFLSMKDDVVDSEIRFSRDFRLSLFYVRYQVEMDCLKQVAERLVNASERYFQSCGSASRDKNSSNQDIEKLRSKKIKLSKQTQRVRERFWSRCGELASELIRVCEGLDARNLHEEICKIALDVFRRSCPSNTPRQLLANCKNEPKFYGIYERG